MSDESRLREAEEVLRDALRIEPSKALVARVRAEASAPRPSRVAAGLGAIAAALLVGAWAALVFGRAPGIQGPEPTVSSRGPETTDPSPVAPTIAVRPTAAREMARGRPAARPSIEVIVPPGQVEALARLVESLNAGEIGPPRSLIDSPGVAASLSEPAPLEIPPLDIAPIEASPALSPIGRGDS